VFVEMDSHVQLVARSETAAIDVAEIAEAFGGGGHDKAAAALIRGQSLRQVKAKLRKLLQESVRPSTTVRQIMSFGVHTLEPNTTVAQAAEMMHRYGHEGFPVVRRGKLVGVLTRREIDRAMHHKMDSTPIADLMHPPASVSPDDSIEKLRTVMTESDLGQVPVVENKAIIGIVTRTDLIRQWNAARPSRAAEIAARLETWLPPELQRLLREASQAARELGFSLYMVGGSVRDLLLNQPNLDLDLVVEGDAIALARHLANKHGGRVHGHTRFGTAKWILENNRPGPPEGRVEERPERPVPPLYALDFTTARTEFYAHPSALPEVERSSIKQDLQRRDFTINTLAICLDPERYGQLLDPFGGEPDLNRRLIRVLHNLSFVEDPTRILRAVRLEQRLGFKIEARTAELIGNALELLHRVSGERLRHELFLIFRESEPEKAMARLNDLGVLAAIFPKLVFDRWSTEKFQAARQAVAEPTPLTYLGLLAYRLTPEEVVDFALRLRLTKADGEALLKFLALRDQVARPLAASDLPPSAVYHLLEDYRDAVLSIFATAVDDPLIRERVQAFQERWRAVAPELSGNDLKRMGVPPGPAYRRILGRLRDARLNGEISTRAEEEEMVRQLIRQPDSRSVSSPAIHSNG
jgi:tRNA nucleotidyltransferase (CCA-adding enzyme)